MPGKRYPGDRRCVRRARACSGCARAWGGYRAATKDSSAQYLAQHGYIVFTLDNRGTGFRGVKFETALYQRMGSVEVEDQVAGVRVPEDAAVRGSGAHRRVRLELRRLHGAHVHDAGAGCIRRGRVRRAGHGLAALRHALHRALHGHARRQHGRLHASDVLTYADKLRAPLLVMHGMADDNVLFTHSTTLFKKLQDSNKPFDMMPYPGSKHGLLRHADHGAACVSHDRAVLRRASARR